MECPHLTKTESVTGLDIQDLKSKLKDGIDCSGLNSDFVSFKMALVSRHKVLIVLIVHTNS